MASIYRDIRAALETKLAAVSGIPTISYENVSYDRANGTSYVETSFLPTLRRPAVRGLNPSNAIKGFSVLSATHQRAKVRVQQTRLLIRCLMPLRLLQMSPTLTVMKRRLLCLSTMPNEKVAG